MQCIAVALHSWLPSVRVPCGPPRVVVQDISRLSPGSRRSIHGSPNWSALSTPKFTTLKCTTPTPPIRTQAAESEAAQTRSTEEPLCVHRRPTSTGHLQWRGQLAFSSKYIGGLCVAFATPFANPLSCAPRFVMLRPAYCHLGPSSGRTHGYDQYNVHADDDDDAFFGMPPQSSTGRLSFQRLLVLCDDFHLHFADYSASPRIPSCPLFSAFPPPRAEHVDVILYRPFLTVPFPGSD